MDASILSIIPIVLTIGLATWTCIVKMMRMIVNLISKYASKNV